MIFNIFLELFLLLMIRQGLKIFTKTLKSCKNSSKYVSQINSPLTALYKKRSEANQSEILMEVN